MWKREEIIVQLRQAIGMLENPNEDEFEFDVMDTTFEFIDYSKTGKK